MRSKTALVATLQAAIDSAAPDTPLNSVYLYGTPRGSVDLEGYRKFIRIDIEPYTLTQSTDENCKEKNVDFTVQNLVLPEEAGNLESEDLAIDEAIEMAEAVFAVINSNPTLSGQVDTVLIPEDIKNCYPAMTSYGAKRYGATFLLGVVNP